MLRGDGGSVERNWAVDIMTRNPGPNPKSAAIIKYNLFITLPQNPKLMTESAWSTPVVVVDVAGLSNWSRFAPGLELKSLTQELLKAAWRNLLSQTKRLATLPAVPMRIRRTSSEATVSVDSREGW